MIRETCRAANFAVYSGDRVAGMERPGARWKYVVFGFIAIAVVLASAAGMASDPKQAPVMGAR